MLIDRYGMMIIRSAWWSVRKVLWLILVTNYVT